MKFLKDFGAIVAIALAALGAAAAYGRLSSDAQTTKTRVDKIEPQVQQNTTDTAVVKSTLDRIESAINRIETKLVQ